MAAKWKCNLYNGVLENGGFNFLLVFFLVIISCIKHCESCFYSSYIRL